MKFDISKKRNSLFTNLIKEGFNLNYFKIFSRYKIDEVIKTHKNKKEFKKRKY